MFKRGLVGEVRGLLDAGVGPESPPFRALGIAGPVHLQGGISLRKRRG